MQDFDLIIQSNFESFSTDYGIIHGNDTILFIKAGQDGNIYGYENKYLEIANRINKKYGYSVVVSSNFEKGSDTISDAIQIIKENISVNPIIYYMGISIGASLGAYYGYKYNEIKRMLLVNPPMMLNLQRILHGARDFKEGKVIFVIGSLDPSHWHSQLISTIKNDLVSLEIIEGADHNFKNMMEDFLSLPEKFLLY